MTVESAFLVPRLLSTYTNENRKVRGGETENEEKQGKIYLDRQLVAAVFPIGYLLHNH